MNSEQSRREVAVIGAGPAGLMAAEEIAKAGFRVTVYERMPSAGRKFLLAGRGGLNLTHSEPLEPFMRRYGARSQPLRTAIDAFPPSALRAWSEALGQKTFEGSSGRVFPESFKTSPLLRAWLRRLGELGVRFSFRHHWQGWNAQGELVFDAPDGRIHVNPAATVLAMGGASWPRLGSDASWRALLAAKNVALAEMQPANCGFEVQWSDKFREGFAGTPLKRIALSVGDVTIRGEAVIANYGLEGGAVYALSPHLRERILKEGSAQLYVSLRPDLADEEIRKRLSAPRGKQSFSNFLRKTIGLAPAGCALLYEWAAANGARLQDYAPAELAALVNRLPVTLTGIAPIKTAISSAGGIAFEEIDKDFMLRKLPGVFAAGEMLDWEAPTGGYLLQACFATGSAAGRSVAKWLAENA